MKNKIFIIIGLLIVLGSIFSYTLISTENVKRKTYDLLEAKNCYKDDIDSINVKHSYLNKILSYDEWIIQVKFKNNPDILYAFVYQNKEIILRGIDDPQLENKEEVIILMDEFNSGNACNTKVYPLIIGEESKYEVSDNLVSLRVKENSLTNSKVTLILENYTNKNYIYGESYLIEYEKDNIWYEIIPINDMNFNMIAYLLKPNESNEIRIDWEYHYGKLSSGKYRIIKDISLDTDKSTEEIDKVYIGAEFIIK